jgi:hypothetical protein
MTCVSWILSLMLSLAPSRLDVSESIEQRRVLYTDVAAAICASTENRKARVFLLAQSYAETKWARYVLEDRCQDGPEGERCDEGRATGPWQIHRYCRKAWSTQRSRVTRFAAGARCALRGYHAGLHRCRCLEGAFAAQRGRGRCRARWARRRVALMRRLEGR